MPMEGLAFYENTKWNALLAKRKQKHKLHWPERSVSVSPDDVILKLERTGVKISRRTLLNYEKHKLIPEPVRGGAGQGKGRTTDYPDNTPAEAFAGHKQIHSYLKLAPQKASEVRALALQIESEAELLRFAKFRETQENKDSFLKFIVKNGHNFNLALQWLEDKSGVEAGVEPGKKVCTIYDIMPDGEIKKSYEIGEMNGGFKVRTRTE